ncbi:MAG TPA: chromosomal replication initiator protein DnaA [Beijerinckiaceae bacterium]|nr:chromosomal replication initiator protein DnaA [Beijerinckiaceae bacterium]
MIPNTPRDISATSPLHDTQGSQTAAAHLEAWKRACRRLRAELGEDIFTAWFARLELHEVNAGAARLSVPTKFLKSWIHSHYVERILAALSAEIAGVERLVIDVRCSGLPPKSPSRPGETSPINFAVYSENAALRPSSEAPGAAASAPLLRSVGKGPRNGVAAECGGLIGSPLDRRLTFATFLVGKSNQLAHAAAMRVARADTGETSPYNPLYIHAAVGLGKTHLLQAIAQSAAAAGRRVIYLTAERFMVSFISALKAQTTITFKERLREIELLIIDDVQFLQGKSIQQEFCHTLNSLIDAGRQIVIAADRPPVDLESLDERVRSRFAGGLCTEMGVLDEPLRIKILETRIAAAKLANPGFEVPPAVISYIARVIQTNGRDLDGAINRLLAHVTLTRTPLTVETTEVAIRDLVRARDPKRVKIEDIQKLVATHYNVSKADILSSRRTATVVKPRQIAMYLSKVLTLRSLPEIGRRFGGRDHTTVLHAVRKIDGLLAKDGPLSEEVDMLKRMLTD